MSPGFNPSANGCVGSSSSSGSNGSNNGGGVFSDFSNLVAGLSNHFAGLTITSSRWYCRTINTSEDVGSVTLWSARSDPAPTSAMAASSCN